MKTINIRERIEQTFEDRSAEAKPPTLQELLLFWIGGSLEKLATQRNPADFRATKVG